MDMIIAKWGNSLGVRIPGVLAKQAGFSEGSALRLTAQKGRIVMEAEAETLEVLVNAITSNNMHDTVETGDPVGREIW